MGDARMEKAKETEQNAQKPAAQRKQLAVKIGVNVCRFVLGGLFVFSGFVKVIDPFGFFYKLQDYTTAFGMSAWVPVSLLFMAGVALSVIEFYVGVCLFLGIHLSDRRQLLAGCTVCRLHVPTPYTCHSNHHDKEYRIHKRQISCNKNNSATTNETKP